MIELMMAIPMMYPSIETTVISIGLIVFLRAFVVRWREKKERKHAQCIVIKLKWGLNCHFSGNPIVADFISYYSCDELLIKQKFKSLGTLR